MNGGVPRFVVLIGVVALVVVAATVGFVVWLRAEARHECELRAAGRDDNRAMWVWLAEQNPDAELIDEFWLQLNSRLAPLKCEGSRLVTVNGE